MLASLLMKRLSNIICILVILLTINSSCSLISKKKASDDSSKQVELESLPLEQQYQSIYLNDQTRSFLNKIYFSELKNIKKAKDSVYRLDKDMIDYALLLKYESKASVSSVKKSRKRIKKYLKDSFKQPVQLNFNLGKLADNLSVYSMAYMFKDKDLYKRAAIEIQAYVQNFLSSPEGYFYHEDSEDKKKLAFVNENAAYASSLLQLYIISKDTQYLEKSTRAVDQMVANASLSAGGFKHDATGISKKLTLLDSLNMANAFLVMYSVTADRDWLYMLKDTADYIISSGIQATSTSDKISLLRSMNLFYHYTGKKEYQAYAVNLMRPLLGGQIKPDASQAAALLLADYELSKDPLHITIVASKQNKVGQELFEEALEYPSLYKRIEWYDHSEGKLSNHDIDYPQLPRAAAFVCVNKTCSMPTYNPKDLDDMLDSLTSQ